MNGITQQNGEQAQPMGMTCEANGCNRNHGADYRRKKAPKGWEDEPIFLCEEHSKGYELYRSTTN